MKWMLLYIDEYSGYIEWMLLSLNSTSFGKPQILELVVGDGVEKLHFSAM